MRPLVRRIFVVVAALTGCAGGSAMTSATDTDATTSTSTSSANTSAASTDGMSSTTMASTSSGSTGVSSTSESDGCGLLCPDLASRCPTPADFTCDVWTQDECCEGEKCTAWANDGGNAWNSSKCAPIDRNPDAIGEPCTAVGGGVSGIDSCEEGAICWWIDGDTGIGVCIAFCQGDERQCATDPKTCCADGFGCNIAASGHLNLCMPECDPLAQDCPYAGLACYPASYGFDCFPDVSGDMGAIGDPCEYINVCDPGSFCADPAAYPDCDPNAAGCCIPFCPLDAPACAPGTECLPFFDPNETPAGYENIGACVIPP